MKGQFLIKCDFSYSCAAADKISTDLRARAVSLRQLSYLLIIPVERYTICLFMKFKTYKFLLLKSFTVIYVAHYAVQSDFTESLKMP